MRSIRTVNLELVREGPPDNQLLSPLTRYLALCGHFENATVGVPYEHRVFLRRLEKLRYERGTLEDTVARQAVLDEVADDIAGVLASIPGLPTSLSTADQGDNVLIHLNLVMSPAELALLPFELAKVPPGFPGGEGNWLSLQTRLPIVITRQIRSALDRPPRWPSRPRILFVASAQGGSIPIDAHLQALLKAIQPWLEPYDADNPDDFERVVAKILTVLPNATMTEIEDVCSREAFTHVHALAHGTQDSGREGQPFGLALGNKREPGRTDVVSGARFATALRPVKIVGAPPPMVVTLASCDSGNMASKVIFNGASFAHELHQAGVPLVVASQFPLSKAGSIHVAEVLYERLLWGEDPREILHDLRRRLYSLHAQDTHDWASLVAYASLPRDEDFAIQLEDTRHYQAKAAINVALWQVDVEIDRIRRSEADVGSEEESNRIRQLFDRVDAAKARLSIEGAYETEGWGLMASTEKRKAEVRFRLALSTASESSHRSASETSSLQASLAGLFEARRCYKKAVNQNVLPVAERPQRGRRSLHWVLVQHIALGIILGESFGDEDQTWWSLAKMSAAADLDFGARAFDRAWAHGSLLELYLLALALPQKKAPIDPRQARDRAIESWRALVSLADDPFIIVSTTRQLRRYVDWWGHELFAASLAAKGIERAADWSPDGPLLTAIRELLAAAP